MNEQSELAKELWLSISRQQESTMLVLPEDNANEEWYYAFD